MPQSRTSAYRFQFFQQTITEWNSLPQEVTNSSSNEPFLTVPYDHVWSIKFTESIFFASHQRCTLCGLTTIMFHFSCYFISAHLSTNSCSPSFFISVMYSNHWIFALRYMHMFSDYLKVILTMCSKTYCSLLYALCLLLFSSFFCSIDLKRTHLYLM